MTSEASAVCTIRPQNSASLVTNTGLLVTQNINNTLQAKWCLMTGLWCLTPMALLHRYNVRLGATVILNERCMDHMAAQQHVALLCQIY